MKTNTAVVILSCDAYRDLWEPFFALFDKYWPDCPFPVYLFTNFASYEWPKVVSVPAARLDNWSDETRARLLQIPEEVVVCLCDDYLLMRPTKTAVILDLCEVFADLEAAYLRLFPHPGPGPDTAVDSRFGAISGRSAALKTSLQCAIWRRDVLLSLLKSGESGWQFEINASKRAEAIDRLFLSVPKEVDADRYSGVYPITYYCTAIRKGKWQRDAVRWCMTQGIQLDLQTRSMETRWDYFKKMYLINKTPRLLRPHVARLLYRYRYHFQ